MCVCWALHRIVKMWIIETIKITNKSYNFEHNRALDQPSTLYISAAKPNLFLLVIAFLPRCRNDRFDVFRSSDFEKLCLYRLGSSAYNNNANRNNFSLLLLLPFVRRFIHLFRSLFSVWLVNERKEGIERGR